MLSKPKRRIAIGVASLVLLQVAAIAIYRSVEGERSAKAEKDFRFEELRGDNLAPDILLERADGTHISLQAIGGDVRLVHFWATWCPPCVDELPGLLATSRKLSAEGLMLIAISMDDDWDVIRRFYSGNIPSEVYRAVDENAHQEFDIVTLPDTYLLRRNGRLKLRYGGARNWLSVAAQEHLRDQIRP